MNKKFKIGVLALGCSVLMLSSCTPPQIKGNINLGVFDYYTGNYCDFTCSNLVEKHIDDSYFYIYDFKNTGNLFINLNSLEANGVIVDSTPAKNGTSTKLEIYEFAENKFREPTYFNNEPACDAGNTLLGPNETFTLKMYSMDKVEDIKIKCKVAGTFRSFTDVEISNMRIEDFKTVKYDHEEMSENKYIPIYKFAYEEETFWQIGSRVSMKGEDVSIPLHAVDSKLKLCDIKFIVNYSCVEFKQEQSKYNLGSSNNPSAMISITIGCLLVGFSPILSVFMGLMA